MGMKKSLLLVIICVCSSLASFAQEDDQLSDNQSNAYAQAQIMVGAFEAGDYNRLLDYTYPAILVMGGGRDMLLSIISQMMSDMKAQGVVVDSARVGLPSQVYPAGDELHALIPQYVWMSTSDTYIYSESTLLAVSDDNGSRWYFLDTRQLTPELKDSFFPDYNSFLVIPPVKEVVVTPKVK